MMWALSLSFVLVVDADSSAMEADGINPAVKKIKCLCIV